MHVVLDLLCNDVIGDRLDALEVRLDDTDAVSKKQWNNYLPSSSFMPPIVPLAECKIDFAIKQSKYSTGFIPKDSFDTVEIFQEVPKSPLSFVEPKRTRPPVERLLKATEIVVKATLVQRK